MTTAFQMYGYDDSELITVVPCDCGDCTGTTVIVAKKLGRKVKKLEVTLDAEDLDQLLELLHKAKEYHAEKGHGTRWSQSELN